MIALLLIGCASYIRTPSGQSIIGKWLLNRPGYGTGPIKSVDDATFQSKRAFATFKADKKVTFSDFGIVLDGGRYKVKGREVLIQDENYFEVAPKKPLDRAHAQYDLIIEEGGNTLVSNPKFKPYDKSIKLQSGIYYSVSMSPGLTWQRYTPRLKHQLSSITIPTEDSSPRKDPSLPFARWLLGYWQPVLATFNRGEMTLDDMKAGVLSSRCLFRADGRFYWLTSDRYGEYTTADDKAHVTFYTGIDTSSGTPVVDKLNHEAYTFNLSADGKFIKIGGVKYRRLTKEEEALAEKIELPKKVHNPFPRKHSGAEIKP